MFVVDGAPPLYANHSIAYAAVSDAAQFTGPGASGPAAALADALVEACRQDSDAFATHLTAANAIAFGQLAPEQRVAILKRMVLLDEAGKPLLSTDAAGQTQMRCEAGGVGSRMRLGAAQTQDNLAFIDVTVDVPQPNSPRAGADKEAEARSVRFGLVREGGNWKLLSLGLLLIDIPALAREWEAADLQSRESAAIAALREIAAALKKYQEAFGRLPETLAQLGPPEGDAASPDKAGLLNAQLASGEIGDYVFRYKSCPERAMATNGNATRMPDSNLLQRQCLTEKTAGGLFTSTRRVRCEVLISMARSPRRRTRELQSRVP